MRIKKEFIFEANLWPSELKSTVGLVIVIRGNEKPRVYSSDQKIPNEGINFRYVFDIDRAPKQQRGTQWRCYES